MTLPCLKNFKNYQNNYYSVLMQIPGFKESALVIEDFLKQIIAEGDFYIKVPTKVLPLILECGYLKNAVQAGKTASGGGPAARIKSTEFMFGCSQNELTKPDYPRFGYLSSPDPKINMLMTYDMTYQYGDATIKLKKDNLFDRTTLTIGTSLDFMSFAYLIPTLLTDPKATCIFGVATHLASGKDAAPYGPGNIKNYLFLADKIKDGTINKNNFYNIDELLGGKNPLLRFFELQFHGDIKLSDFERIDYMEEPDKEVIKGFEAKGIPVEEQSII